jgi:hypothetical protein
MRTTHLLQHQSQAGLKRSPTLLFRQSQLSTQSQQMQHRACQLLLPQFHARVTILSLRVRAWEFPARLLVRVTILLHRHRAWVDLVKVVRLVPVVRVRLVPVAQVALVVQLAHVRLVPAALRVQVSAVRVQLELVLLQAVLQVSLVRAVAQLAAAAAV